ncbi:beta-galactosidase [Echinicola marina]|uniref:glycoside hydrolase family 2 protein n=1 Tax=Echinicola marina TaxID=2859768 RepID=UPI001CF6BC5B|nr:glycoside hydrolase family 2 TIM barrel-domain containing protein [Echinicola marina]UCS92481.1 beta-galactosidase [Echinicola marina]
MPKSISIFFICLYFGILNSSAQSINYQRVYLSGKDAASAVNWDFKVSAGRNANEWSEVPVPSNWELHGFGTYNYGHDHSHPDKALGKEVGFYKHQFEVPKAWKDKVINIVFGAAMTDTEVWINGQSAGPIHQGGFYEFKYNISGLLKFGQKNLLEVKVSKHSSNESINKAERQADFWLFGGIFRPVYLEVLPQYHFDRIAINANENGQFESLLQLNKSLKQASVKVDLYDQDRLIGSISEQISGQEGWLKGQFKDIQSWNPEQPKLYRAKFQLLHRDEVVYSKEEQIGFRTVELREKDGIYINNVKVIFKGVNRHSFYPNSGRALSWENHLEDIRLMKEMNMNAVRMSHYPPDEAFLDLCDSLGMFVLDEVTGWQDGYDTIVGPKLIKETVLRDENHPSVVIWDHGNEGGWDFRNEPWFHFWDIQKRPVIYPWLRRNGVDTFHYPVYGAGIQRLSNGQDIFMPTEFLHGLYDGGHGAGLEDFWKNYMSNPAAAGGFLWVFSDEAVLRTDLKDSLDADGNHAPDGILGPYREKEGSFYTIKDIWSPVQVKPMVINDYYDGQLALENKYLYTDLRGYHLQWSLMSFDQWEHEKLIRSGVQVLPRILPGERKKIKLDLPPTLAKADWLKIAIIDPSGMEVHHWTWPIGQAKEFTQRRIALKGRIDHGNLKHAASGNKIKVGTDKFEYEFDQKSGMLIQVIKGGENFGLSGPIQQENNSLEKLEYELDEEGNFLLTASYSSYPKQIQWKVFKNGLLKVVFAAPDESLSNKSFLGVNFSLPETMVKGISWLGNGPYRVWKNRMRGPQFGIWQKDYNNTITGYSNGRMEYPEFKGYHANLYAYNLALEQGNMMVYTETAGLFFRLFSPENAPFATKHLRVPFPKGDLSFLYHIPPIGTKFHSAQEMGPQAEPARDVMHKGDEKMDIILWFDFSPK